MPAAKKGPGSKADNVVPLRTPRPCPICGKKSTQDFHPFCSKHCADVDLNRWLKGSYAIPAIEPPDDWNEGEGGPSEDRDEGEDER